MQPKDESLESLTRSGGKEPLASKESSASKKPSASKEPSANKEQKPRNAARPAGKRNSPIYQQIARTLKDEIVSGVFPVGSQLPTEDGLCERFSVSRYTVREALRLLREDGLVVSRQGAGTVVIPPRAASEDTQQVMSINDLVAFASGTRLAISNIRTVMIDDKAAAWSGLAKGTEWLQVSGLRLGEKGPPVCRADYFINRDYAAVGRLLQRHTGPIFPLIEDLFGESIVEVQQQISAAIMPTVFVAELKVKEGTPALEVRRTYKNAEDQVIQVTINTHPAARFKHSMTMRRVKV